MKDITVIIPLADDCDGKLLEKARKSIKGVTTVIYVGNDNVLPKTLKTNEINIINDGNRDFCSQINLAVEKVTTKYFSILESDDEYTPFWFKCVDEYVKKDPTDASVYLPLTEVYDFNKPDQPLSYINEAVWASSFSDEIGCIDSTCLEEFSDFNLTGAVFKTEDFNNIGKLKPSIKFSFWYEFLLRATHNGKRLYVIPKVGYHHYVERPNSLMEQYRKELTPEDAAHWMEIAKKEYFFTKERNIEELYG